MNVFQLEMSLSVFLVAAITVVQTVPPVTSDVFQPASKPCYPCICTVDQTIANCSHQDLSCIPSTLPEKLNVLLMDHNNISRLSTKFFSKFKHLTQLDISNNHIVQVMDDSFLGLIHLEYLHMEQNNAQLPQKAISVLYSLEELSVDGNTNMIFGECFQNLSKLIYLSMSGNKGRCEINNIYNHTFKYVPHLKTLNLSNCMLENIDVGAFLPLKNIEELDISDNRRLQFRGFRNATYGLINSSIRILKANRIVKKWSLCNILYNEDTNYLRRTKLEKLFFDDNRLELCQKGALLNLPDTLWYISARRNMFTLGAYISDLSSLKNVTHAYLGTDETNALLQYTSDENGMCEMDSENACQSDIEKSLDYGSEHLPASLLMPNNTSGPFIIVLPPHLQVLHVVCEQMSFEITWMLFTNNSLTTLNLTCNLLSNWTGPVEGLENLEILDLSFNMATDVSPFFFKGFPLLKKLYISLNFLGSVMHLKNKSLIFDGLTSLEVLDLSKNDIHYLPEDLFHDLVSLKTLNLSHNEIYLDIPLRIGHLKNLQMLDLSNNHVRWFSSTLVKDLDTLAESNNITINLTLNPIACTCYNVEFLNWMILSKVTFIHIKTYTCAFDNKTFSPIDKFEDIIVLLEKQCNVYSGLVVACLFALGLLFVIVGGALAYRHRWSLRYWYYAANLRCKRRSLLNGECGTFRFDAFVCHADEDEQFAKKMTIRIEDEGKRKVNLHNRDFLPGKRIPTNILSAVQMSRKTVVILSKNFVQSYWCNYELQMANMESRETGRDVLVIIMYGDILPKKIPKEVLYHLKTECYIEYPRHGNQNQTDIFWERLIEAVEST
ncbi:LOW QUALITY PROTEIN: toll-like receptor 4 [Gigantopelta aegis]|uniref:LOW QUALITY PROTEIN: toll-like receptor 4 n=1 Tax=Gigantopelta aegis TaxID=1735272 RepID=UPI001B88AABB|nr:LOW QUALITY PROTEIN: toll-like receptor 4 [Gigantopelta aegis]